MSGDAKKNLEASRFGQGKCLVSINTSPQRVGEIQEGQIAIGGALTFRPEDRPAMLVLDRLPRAIFADANLAGMCSLSGHALAVLGELYDLVWRVRRFAPDADAAWMAKMDKSIEQTLAKAATLFPLAAEFTGTPRVDHSECPPGACRHKVAAAAAPAPAPAEEPITEPALDPNKVVH